MIFKITPIGKPRMTQRDKWKKRPVVNNYYAFKDRLKAAAKGTGYIITPVLDIIFILPMPDSWSKKKKAEMDGKPHQQKPDADNMMKAFKDCLAIDDSFVYDERSRKFWGQEGLIIINQPVIKENDSYAPTILSATTN